MADFAANLNTNRQFSTSRPSVFDLLAQDSLRASLQPAFDFVLKTLSIKYPETLGKFEAYSDEVFYLMLAVIERHFIWNHDATFSEHFYGLSRVNVTGKETSAKITLFQKVASLLCLILLPYLKRKLENSYLKLKEQMVYNGPGNESEPFPYNYVKKFYPYVHASTEATKLVLTLSYIVKLTDFHTLAHGCFKMALRFSGGFTEKQADNSPVVTGNGNRRMLDILKQLPCLLRNGFSLATEYALPVTVFFLKFLEWWYSSENSPHHTMMSRIIPPPPKELQESCSSHKLPPTSLQCPLCYKVHRNPTALSRSGYVFCYKCIYRFVYDNRCCPVTKLECSLDDLVRLHF
ncbi:peroxisome assembly protein 12-like [Rhopilema esculentum]|uniref:peroxisome assembly protein 12-like n=1 Tax=Rhopilema esculentum TaxID=499914 RepID=UPI0031E09958